MNDAPDTVSSWMLLIRKVFDHPVTGKLLELGGRWLQVMIHLEEKAMALSGMAVGFFKSVVSVGLMVLVFFTVENLWFRIPIMLVLGLVTLVGLLMVVLGWVLFRHSSRQAEDAKDAFSAGLAKEIA